jgi:hypothetical protein
MTLVETGGIVTDSKKLVLPPPYLLENGWVYITGDGAVVEHSVVRAESEGTRIAVQAVSEDFVRVLLYESAKGECKLILSDGQNTERMLPERHWVEVTREGGSVKLGPIVYFDPSIIPNPATTEIDKLRAEIEKEQIAEEVP